MKNPFAHKDNTIDLAGFPTLEQFHQKVEALKEAKIQENMEEAQRVIDAIRNGLCNPDTRFLESTNREYKYEVPVNVYVMEIVSKALGKFGYEVIVWSDHSSLDKYILSVRAPKPKSRYWIVRLLNQLVEE